MVRRADVMTEHGSNGPSICIEICGKESRNVNVKSFSITIHFINKTLDLHNYIDSGYSRLMLSMQIPQNLI